MGGWTSYFRRYCFIYLFIFSFKWYSDYMTRLSSFSSFFTCVSFVLITSIIYFLLWLIFFFMCLIFKGLVLVLFSCSFHSLRLSSFFSFFPYVSFVLIASIIFLLWLLFFFLYIFSPSCVLYFNVCILKLFLVYFNSLRLFSFSHLFSLRLFFILIIVIINFYLHSSCISSFGC